MFRSGMSYGETSTVSLRIIIASVKTARMQQKSELYKKSRYWMIRIPVLLLGLLFGGYATAQQLTDSTTSLSEASFLSILRKYHPVLKQADTRFDRAGVAMITARGGFDPVLQSEMTRKRFGGDLYYNYYNPELMIPTWYGVEVYAGLENINGNRVNTQSTLGQTSYLGISVPLLKDLAFDKRRAVLQ